jgi:hypothetical protein
MTLTARVLLAYLVIALIIFAWMFRVDSQPSATTWRTAIITDRWLGTVQYCNIVGGGDCSRIYPPPAKSN